MNQLFFDLGALSVKQASNPLKPIKPGPQGAPPVPSLATQRQHNTIFAPLTKTLYGTPESRLAQSQNLKSPPSKLPPTAPGVPAIDEFRLPGPRNPDPIVSNWEHRFSIPLTQDEQMRNLARQQATIPKQRRELLVDAVRQGGFTSGLGRGYGKKIPELADLGPLVMQQTHQSYLRRAFNDMEPVNHLNVLGATGPEVLGPNKVPLPDQQQITPRGYNGYGGLFRAQGLRALREGAANHTRQAELGGTGRVQGLPPAMERLTRQTYPDSQAVSVEHNLRKKYPELQAVLELQDRQNSLGIGPAALAVGGGPAVLGDNSVPLPGRAQQTYPGYNLNYYRKLQGLPPKTPKTP